MEYTVPEPSGGISIMHLTKQNLNDLFLISVSLLIVLVLYGTIKDRGVIALVLFIGFAVFNILSSCFMDKSL